MEEKLINYFSKFEQLNQQEEAAILNGLDIQIFPKNSILVIEGQIANENYFILKGCVRQYYMKQGEEITSNFFTEEQWLLPSISIGEDKKSKYFLTCTEECTLVVGNEEKGNALLDKFPRFQNISRLILEKEIINQQNEMARYITSTPEERYLHIRDQRPTLIERIPQYLLASYIGIKPESLSRIRKRMATKG